MQLSEPRIHRFTRDEYYRMADAGLFQDRRVQLIEGRIVELAPQRNEHYTCILLTQKALSAAFGEGVVVRVQGPLDFGRSSQPEPDLAVVSGSPRDYTDHPTTALLVVEVSDTTLGFDRRHKARLYAKANIGEYWIINLSERCVEVHREPQRDATGRCRYGDVRITRADESLEPLAAPGTKIAVGELLP